MTHIARSSLIIALFFGAEKLLGFIRQVLIARQFGLSRELDAFNAANNIPDLLFFLISGGALAMAFIPVLSETLQKSGRPAAWELFSRIANLVFIVTAAFSILIALFAEPLVNWKLGVAPGFAPSQRALVADLMRLNLFATLLFSLSGLVMAGLQANQHFWLPALAPSMYDLGTMFGVVILAPERGYQLGPITLPAFGLGVYGLVYGVILGAALFLLIQLPGLVRYNFRWKPAIGLNHPGVRQVLGLLGPRVATVFCIQLVFLSQDNIASRLAAGSVSILVYSWLFMQVPETLIGTALGTALLPTLSEQIVRAETEAYRRTLNHALRVILALTVPAAVLLGIGLRPFISLLGFDAAGVDLVMWTTRAYLLGLVGHSLLEVAVRAFYARQDARTPLISAGLTTLTFIGLAFLFTRWLGVVGIGLANSVAYTGQALALWWLLGRRIPGVFSARSTLWRTLAAAIAAALLVFAVLALPLPPALAGPGLLLAVAKAAAALAAGGLLVLPFIWTELKLLVKL